MLIKDVFAKLNITSYLDIFEKDGYTHMSQLLRDFEIARYIPQEEARNALRNFIEKHERTRTSVSGNVHTPPSKPSHKSPVVRRREGIPPKYSRKRPPLHPPKHTLKQKRHRAGNKAITRSIPPPPPSLPQSRAPSQPKLSIHPPTGALVIHTLSTDPGSNRRTSASSGRVSNKRTTLLGTSPGDVSSTSTLKFNRSSTASHSNSPSPASHSASPTSNSIASPTSSSVPDLASAFRSTHSASSVSSSSGVSGSFPGSLSAPLSRSAFSAPAQVSNKRSISSLTASTSPRRGTPILTRITTPLFSTAPIGRFASPRPRSQAYASRRLHTTKKARATDSDTGSRTNQSTRQTNHINLNLRSSSSSPGSSYPVPSTSSEPAPLPPRRRTACSESPPPPPAPDHPPPAPPVPPPAVSGAPPPPPPPTKLTPLASNCPGQVDFPPGTHPANPIVAASSANALSTLTTQKPFSCSECKKKYKNKRTLLQHWRWVHDPNSRTPHCSVCNTNFCSPLALQNHTETKHAQEPRDRVPCPKCDDTFASKQSLSNHLRLIHNERIKPRCHVCGREVVTMTVLRDHMRRRHPEFIQYGSEASYPTTTTATSPEHPTPQPLDTPQSMWGSFHLPGIGSFTVSGTFTITPQDPAPHLQSATQPQHAAQTQTAVQAVVQAVAQAAAQGAVARTQPAEVGHVGKSQLVAESQSAAECQPVVQTERDHQAVKSSAENQIST